MFRAFLVISAPYKLVKPFDANWPSQYPAPHPRSRILLFLFFTDAKISLLIFPANTSSR